MVYQKLHETNPSGRGDFLTKFCLSHTGQQLRRRENWAGHWAHTLPPRRSPEASSQHLSGQWAEARLSTYWPCRQTVKWDTSSSPQNKGMRQEKGEARRDHQTKLYWKFTARGSHCIFQNPEKKKKNVDMHHAPPFPKIHKTDQRPCREYRIWPQANRMRGKRSFVGQESTSRKKKSKSGT